ncbi:MAG: response regulator transcription factor [Candidatus Competibacteraceae bacterium]|jgi:DNA-binding response OmpR family regulator|nr:response regulator transcription factor [Candidatus Competibacteraceae bacterium]
MSHRVLIIEDDREIANLLQLHLKDILCEADLALTGRDALGLYAERRHDLVILDLMLPDIDGLAICRQLRNDSRYVPILMLTSKATELDRVVGLEMGADDYLTKPFSFPELLARVKALLRRANALSQPPAAQDQILAYGDMVIDIGKRRVRLGKREPELTAKEFDLLLHFARHPGRVFTRTQLLDQVWGYGHDGYEHTVNSHINRLRAKIEANPTQPRYILTVWGVGYQFSDRC